ncbi:DNA topoisomerase 2 [Massospora cicadina]|nr:DNA topoisomerase 2 [Massospora cicadina]
MDSLIKKDIQFVPGFFKIFDEVLVNTADKKIWDPTMTKIKATIDLERNLISVYNNSSRILVEIHKEEKVYVSELIFGHLLTLSNYDNSKKKVVGGCNGYGAKLCNIFSTKFIVEMASKELGKKYYQKFTKNMSVIGPSKITKFEKGEDKFQMNHLNADIVGLLKQRVYDMCTMVKGVSVFLNDSKLKLNNFKAYIYMYLKSAPGPDREDLTRGLYLNGQLQQVSFINSISTTKRATHMNYVVDAIVKLIQEALDNKKLKRDFAKALVMAGLTKVEWDYYGMFPLRGKLINMQDASPAQVKGNKELINICKIMGLNGKVDNLDTSKLTITENNPSAYNVKYYKWLAMSDWREEIVYFSNLTCHMICFEPMQDDERQIIDLAFNKKKARTCKEWLCHGESITYSCLINKELIHFSMADDICSTPLWLTASSLAIARLCMAAFFHLMLELKVAMLTGSITEKVSYHCRDYSLASIIIDLAQNFVGANNINLLASLGQFGSYTQGGWMQPTTQLLFHKDDMPLFNCLDDDVIKVEPEFSVMEVLIIMLNRYDGISTGWSTNIPSYNSMDVASNLQWLMQGEFLIPVLPWYHGFTAALSSLAKLLHKLRCKSSINTKDDDGAFNSGLNYLLDMKMISMIHELAMKLFKARDAKLKEIGFKGSLSQRTGKKLPSAVKPTPKSMAKAFALDKPESKPKASPKRKNPKVSDNEEDFEVEALLLPLPRLTLSPSFLLSEEEEPSEAKM